MDVTWRIEDRRIAASRGSRSTHAFAAAGARLGVADRPAVHAADRRCARSLRSVRSRKRSRRTPGRPPIPLRRTHRHERPRAASGSPASASITAIGTGVDAFRAGPAGRPLAGQADRPVRPVAVPHRRSPPRSTTSTRSPGCRRGPRASSTGSASSGSSPAGSPSRTPGLRPGEAGAASRSGSGSTSASRSAGSPTREEQHERVPRARDRRPSPRTSPSRCSAAQRRRTSGSPSTSAGRSSRRPTPCALGRGRRSARPRTRSERATIDAAIAGGARSR